MASLTSKTLEKTKSTPAGVIPFDWAARELGYLVAQPISGISVVADDDPPEPGHPGVLRLSCVTGGRFNPADLKTPQNGQASRLSVYAEQDTILISRSNTPSLVGASAYVSDDYPTSFLPDTLWLLRAKNPNAVSMRWLSYLIRSDDYRRALQNIASGTSQSMKKIQKGAFLKLDAPIPPLPEQSKIADILSAWDEALEKLDALIAAKARRKQALMQQLLTGKKRVKGAKGKCKKMQLGDLAENCSEQNKGKLGTEFLYGVTKADGVVPMREHVKGESFHRCKTLEHDWFAYNPMRINIGSIARWQGERTVMVSGDYVVFRCFEDRLSPAYLDQLRKSWMWQSFVTRGGNGSVRIRIYFSDLAEFTFPCPSLEEQQHIAAILDAADQELTLLRKQRNTLEQQKRGLMQRLLTGKLRVKTN